MAGRLFGNKPLFEPINDGLLLIETLGTNFCEIWTKIKIFIQENAFENLVFTMVPFFSAWRC